MPPAERPIPQQVQNYGREFLLGFSRQTPEQITQAMSLVWNEVFDVARLNIGPVVVSPCDRDAGEIEQLKAQGRMLIYVPQQFTGIAGFGYLQQLFPRLFPAEFDPRVIRDTQEGEGQVGWLDVEFNTLTPHKGLSERQMRETFRERNLRPQTLATYSIGRAISEVIFAGYNQGAGAHWEDSRDDGCATLATTFNIHEHDPHIIDRPLVVGTNFDTGGISIFSMPDEFGDPHLGARSAGKKQWSEQREQLQTTGAAASAGRDSRTLPM
ncbi:MAG: hypothetical protein ACREGI_01190 [Candidatus Levyibacteriota bacterium]